MGIVIKTGANKIEIGKRIKKIRLRKGLTQEGFSSQLGIDRTHVSNIERGKTSPSGLLLSAICSAFKINYNWVMHGLGPIDSEKESTLDLDLLTDIMRIIEDRLSEAGTASLTSDKKAQVIGLIYKECYDNDNDPKEASAKYLKLALP
ncbi:helix-turn-helix transcriptional regulator [Desulfococcaceae bacterium HSG8]|nr:helix-turn-helix transcriptional regulator [Desulfococcaceae bacterium HSG8]